MPRLSRRVGWLAVWGLALAFCGGRAALGAEGAEEAGWAQGPGSAPVTIHVYSSLTCPACAKLHLETLEPLAGSYVAQGRVRLIHCLVPSRRDTLGMRAARCVHAARRLGRGPEVTAALFSTQDRWMNGGDLEPCLSGVLNTEELERLLSLVDSGELEPELRAEMRAGREARVRATPTMLIRHGELTTPIVGAVSYSILSRYLDRVLEGS